MEYDDDFPTCVSTSASLRLLSSAMDPTSMTAILGISPSRSFAKGEVYGTHGHVRKFNGWFLDSEPAVSSKDTRRHIDWILSQVGDKAPQFAHLRSKGVDTDISCLWISTGQGGPILSPSQMEVLARLGVDVWWDVYFEGRPQSAPT